jgi:hypothetical protein
MGFAGTRLALSKLTLMLSVLGLASTKVCFGQLCATTHATDLYCLLPYTFHTQAAPFNAIFAPFGTELSALPTARPAGQVLIFDHGILAPADKSLGAIFTERPETLGKRRIFVGFTYQNFSYDTIDGTNLKHIPIVLYYPPLQVYTTTNTRLDVRVGQYAFVAAAGLTSRIDVSVAIPFEHVSLAASVNGNEYGPGGASAVVSEHVPGSASGRSDVVIGGKGALLDRKSVQLAAGLDVRIPSGDELNFLGSGTFGVRPYVSFSRQHRFSQHVNFGYQWNGDSILNASAAGAKQTLPTDIFYMAGASVEAKRRLTVTGDVIGKHFYNSPRLAAPTPVAIPNIGNALSVQPYVGGFTSTDLSVGFKYRTVSHLVVTGNVTMKLDDAGLRARAIPLGGLSYSF